MKNICARAFGRATALAATAALAAVLAPAAFAQAPHAHDSTQPKELTNDQKELVQIVRNSTARFKDVNVAKSEGYALTFGCVTGDDFGAMGMHFLKGEFATNPPLTKDGLIDPTRPQIVIYEPTANGGMNLIGADYLLFADAWDAKHPQDPPMLKGQLFHYFGTPNRFGLPAFYTLHVWAWKDNPLGAFVNWHPDVSCKSFVGTSN